MKIVYYDENVELPETKRVDVFILPRTYQV
jgi:hypothetical protein